MNDSANSRLWEKAVLFPYRYGTAAKRMDQEWRKTNESASSASQSFPMIAIYSWPRRSGKRSGRMTAMMELYRALWDDHLRMLESFQIQFQAEEKERLMLRRLVSDWFVSGLSSNLRAAVSNPSKAVLETPLPIVTTVPINPHSTTSSESTSIGYAPTVTIGGTQPMTNSTAPKDLPITRNGSRKLWNGVRTIRTTR